VKHGKPLNIFKDVSGLINKIQGLPGQQKNPGLFHDVATLLDTNNTPLQRNAKTYVY